MKLWPFRKSVPELDIPPFPPLEKVEIDPLEQSCIDRLRRENTEAYIEIHLLKSMNEVLRRNIDEKDATIRSLRSSLGNRTKAIKRLKGDHG